jgi:hypothetical protein
MQCTYNVIFVVRGTLRLAFNTLNSDHRDYLTRLFDLRTNNDYTSVQHQLAGFHNRDGVCLLRGTNYVFNYNSGQILSLKRVRCSEVS